MTRLDQICRRLEAAQQEVFALCKGKQWRMTIPVQADDSDRCIMAALGDIRDLLALAEAVKAIDWNYVLKMVWTPPSMGLIGIAKKEHQRVETLQAIVSRLDAEVEE